MKVYSKVFDLTLRQWIAEISFLSTGRTEDLRMCVIVGRDLVVCLDRNLQEEKYACRVNVIDRLCGRKPVWRSCLCRGDDFALPCSRTRVGKSAVAPSRDVGLWMTMMDCPWSVCARPVTTTDAGDKIALLHVPGDEARKCFLGQLG